ncbi:type II toxin-antitoxin system prevent-host-death family antitoxin [Desulfovibrio sulfodismutans]|uniref:Antitoxin n=1 Tax=Desulfolutivibrio sulfodismutans TaxID=63561 RepID=A0A7K3NI76_9BACT|nr:type II toxin-antitoxin system prevent-host-death family antitoxin [Desulfolutivibrio sulfodismutans]NDY55870.1 type II toxin-antitoxin system prevent-host-death family antitoxin [Desulfolutivibrio sulfodismutans]QLA14272.1 type II toxin-antitoxin system prevent-host-death family antitoxin [Desulfolutivibrio sulfodismutans DSM 3696]
MRQVSLSYVKNRLSAIMDQVYADGKPIVITRPDGPSVVLMSLPGYNGLEETLYLLASPANATRLRASLAHARSGEVCEKSGIPL